MALMIWNLPHLWICEYRSTLPLMLPNQELLRNFLRVRRIPSLLDRICLSWNLVDHLKAKRSSRLAQNLKPQPLIISPQHQIRIRIRIRRRVRNQADRKRMRQRHLLRRLKSSLNLRSRRVGLMQAQQILLQSLRSPGSRNLGLKGLRPRVIETNAG